MCDRRFRIAFLALLAWVPVSLQGQDFLANHRIKGLTGLDTAAIVLQYDTTGTDLSYSDLGDMLTVALARNAPSLVLVGTAKTPNWIDLNVIHVEGGAMLEILVYRWVTVHSSRQVIVSAVWSHQYLMVGEFSRRRVQDAIDDMLTGFGADLARSRH